MKATFQVLVQVAMLTCAWVANAQTPETNGSGFHLLSVDSSTNDLSVKDDVLIPLIQFNDVPITTAIENLARIAGINYLLDPHCREAFTGSKNDDIPQPLITCRLTNITARVALVNMLDQHGFTFIEDPITRIARISCRSEMENQLDIGLLGLNANGPVFDTNDVIPQIKISNVPLESFLESLIKIADINAEVDIQPVNQNGSTFDSHSTTWYNRIAGQPTSPYGQWFNSMPILSVRWTDITARQAIIALCENYDLVIVKDETTGVIHLKPRKIKRHHHLRLR